MNLTVFSTAREQAAAIRVRAISARELLGLHLDQISSANPRVNALVNLDPDRAMATAAAADDYLIKHGPIGPLHGLPHAFKDTHAVAGWPTTYGSPLYADHVPESDDLIVERIRAAGVIPIAKTNVPEFAAGSHTFNPIFGTTLNPWDQTRSAGGSSGGAAAALATGMVPLADGSDMGGSLRNPASFCGVVGLRPSLGRVPEWPLANQWETTSVGGPMARTVSDLALLLSVIAGPDPRAPQALGDPGAGFANPIPAPLQGLRVAWTADLGGLFAVDDAVRAVHTSAGHTLQAYGAGVYADAPDLSLGDDTFRTLRAWHLQARYGALLAASPGRIKESLAANIRAGESLTGADIARGYAQRTSLSETMRTFFARFDILMLPTAQVTPFPADQEFPATVAGQPMADYLDWMKSCYLISVTGCPAISVPAGRSPDGLPIGVQLVGPHGSDARLLSIAMSVEAALANR